MDIKVQPYDIKRCPNEVSKLKSLGVINKIGLYDVVSCEKRRDGKAHENKVFYVKKKNMFIPIIFSRSTGRFAVEGMVFDEIKKGIFTPYAFDLGRYDEFASHIKDAWDAFPSDWEDKYNPHNIEVPKKLKPNNLLGALVGSVTVGTEIVDIRPHLKVLLQRAEMVAKVLVHRAEIF